MTLLDTPSQPATANTFPSLSHILWHVNKSFLPIAPLGVSCGVVRSVDLISLLFSVPPKTEILWGTRKHSQAQILPAWGVGGGGVASWHLELSKAPQKVSAQQPSLESWANMHSKVDSQAHRKTRLWAKNIIVPSTVLIHNPKLTQRQPSWSPPVRNGS